MKQGRYRSMKNRWFKLALSFFCIFVVIICILFSDKSKNNTEGINKSWMRDISDEKKLSDITIPGVHNAAALNLPLSLFSKCQNESISVLLNSGYRYLDIRAGVSEKSGEKRLVLYHNFIKCYSTDSIIPKELTFNDVVTECYEFLEENPSETIIFMLKYEYGELSVSEFEKLVMESIEKNSDNWLLTYETPCLKEARGKIVLYRRYKDEASLGKRSGIECIWDEQKNTKLSGLNDIFASENEDSYLIQDMFKLSADDKWEAFSYVLNNAPKMDDAVEGNADTDNVNGNDPTINFLSTTGTGSVGIPAYYARILNKKFMNCALEGEISPQWIIVDFGDEKLANKIIKSNAS